MLLFVGCRIAFQDRPAVSGVKGGVMEKLLLALLPLLLEVIFELMRDGTSEPRRRRGQLLGMLLEAVKASI